MNRISGYLRWMILAVVLLIAGVCYSCGSKPGKEMLRTERAETEPVDGRSEEEANEKASGSGGTASAIVTAGSSAAAATGSNDASCAQPTPYDVQETTAAVEYFVHVCGEVRSPGVYRLGEGSRVYDAIQAAGGVTEAAAPDALNLAEPICDGMKITVPDHTQEQEPEAAAAAIERPTGAAAGAGTSAESSGKININTADRAALMTLKGIGEARADAILEYRAEHGNFSTIEDIMKVPGIKDAAFQKIKDRIQT